MRKFKGFKDFYIQRMLNRFLIWKDSTLSLPCMFVAEIVRISLCLAVLVLIIICIAKTGMFHHFAFSLKHSHSLKLFYNMSFGMFILSLIVLLDILSFYIVYLMFFEKEDKAKTP